VISGARCTTCRCSPTPCLTPTVHAHTCSELQLQQTHCWHNPHNPNKLAAFARAHASIIPHEPFVFLTDYPSNPTTRAGRRCALVLFADLLVGRPRLRPSPPTLAIRCATRRRCGACSGRAARHTLRRCVTLLVSVCERANLSLACFHGNVLIRWQHMQTCQNPRPLAPSPSLAPTRPVG
jgi:hypothetical protein